MTHYGFAHMLGSTGSIGPRVAYLVLGLILLLLAFGVFAKATALPSQTLHGAGGFDVNIDGNTTVLFNNGYIALTTDTNKVCMEPSTSHAQQINMYNLSDDVRCFAFDADPVNTSLDVSLSQTDFCLNKFESTTFVLSVNSKNADLRHYTVKIADTNEDANIHAYLDYTVGSCSSFSNVRIEENDATVCAGSEAKIPVIVSNYSSTTQTIHFNAENQFILPYFEKEKVVFSAGATKTMNLIINATHAPTGKYPITVTGTMGSVFVTKYMNVTIADCSTVKKKTLDLIVPGICYDVTRGQTFSGSFGVRCTDDEQKVALAIAGIDGELSQTNFLLDCSTQARVNYTVHIPETLSTGSHTFTVSGTTEAVSPFADESTFGYTTSREVCYNVLGQTQAQVSLTTSEQKTIVIGKSENFDLVINNTGDFPLAYALSTVEKPTGVQVFYPESTVTVAKGESRIVRVMISANTNAIAADNQYVRVLLDGNMPLRATIYFNITDSPQLSDLEIVSATKSLNVTDHSVGDYFLIVRNGTDSEIRDVNLMIDNLPKDVNYDSQWVARILPGNTATIRGTLRIGDVNTSFNPTLVIRAGNVMVTKQFAVHITHNDTNSASGTGFFGLFALSTTSIGGLGSEVLTIAGVIFITLILLIIVVYIIRVITTPAKKKEAWVEQN